ncbi:hypothetical protein C1645_826628 [Glomus cerebriforme]|uniref:Uncharacterized protein n=1 Tax=Glomus cerebriforme TaxID=658196 RepID=A0A397SPZ5_9GLOM|nr:hypothetical protein C1645_826628 [Glomus cerebriforme]
MSNLSSSWYFTFHVWISSNYTFDHQSLQSLNQYLTLLIELHRKKYEFTKKFYILIQKQINDLTKFNEDDEPFFKNCQQFKDQIIEFKDVQFKELLKFVLIEIKDQVEFGEKLRIEKNFKEKGCFEYFDTLNDEEFFEFEDVGYDEFKDINSSTSSTASSSPASTSSIFSIKFSSKRQFYPKRIFDYLNNYEDNLYKLILKKQFEIIYEVGNISENMEILKRLLSNNNSFLKKDSLLFFIMIYSTYQLLEKLKSSNDIENRHLIIDLIYDLENLIVRDYFEDFSLDDPNKINLFEFILYSIITIIFQFYFFTLFLNICSAY